MPEVEHPDYVMYEMVIKEAKKTKKTKPNTAAVLNMEDIQKKLEVWMQIYILLFIALLGPQAAEVSRGNIETEQLALLNAKKKRGEEV